MIIFLTSVELISCDNKTVFEGKKDMKEGYWLYKEPVHFDFEIEYSDIPYDLSFFVRNTIDYPYQNLYLQYYLEDSTGNVVKEKLYNVLLFDEKTGKPLGSGVGDIYNLEKVFLKNYHFPKSGPYQIRLDQFMRHDTLKNIQSVGFKIEKTDISEGN